MELFRFSSILHPTDFSDSDHLAVVHALKVALESRAKLTLVHVVPRGDRVDWSEYPRTRDVLAEWGVVQPDASHTDVLNTGLNIRKSLRKGHDIPKEIAGEVRKDGTDLLVLATHQPRGLTRLVKKPLAESIARLVNKPVLFVPREAEGFVDEATGATRLRNILVPIAENPPFERALEVAGSLAAILTREPVVFRLLYVGEDLDQPEVKLPTRKGWEFQQVCREGKVVETILAECDELGADLIAMATSGRENFMDSLRGTSTEQVLRDAPCPLLAVPVHS